eukprot:5941036-Pyramimonas_sp.AAC.1
MPVGFIFPSLRSLTVHMVVNVVCCCCHDALCFRLRSRITVHVTMFVYSLLVNPRGCWLSLASARQTSSVCFQFQFLFWLSVASARQTHDGLSGVMCNNGEELPEEPEHVRFFGVLCNIGEGAFEELAHVPGLRARRHLSVA